MITCEEIISTKITVIIALNLLTTGHQDKFIAQSCLDREGSIYVKNKLGLSWAKLSQSWDLAKLLLSYITSVSNFIFDISFNAAMLAGVSWF